MQGLGSRVLSAEPPPLRGLELPGLSVPCQDSRVLLGPALASPPGAAAGKLSPGWGWVVPDSSYFPLPRDHCPFWYLVSHDCCLVYSACLLWLFQTEGSVWSLSIHLGWKRKFPTSVSAPCLLSCLSSGCQYNADCQGFFKGMCVKCRDFASTTLAGPHKHACLLNFISL